MAIDLTGYPYLDRFNPDDRYNKVLFNPDRALQASEVNEVQSIMQNSVSRLGDVLMTDGDFIDGMDYRINGNNITIGEGLIYLAGKVHNVEEQTIPFSNTGDFTVCVQLEQSIVTSEDDPSLNDQTAGVENYLSSGADRLKEEVIVTSETENTVPIYEFRDGDLFVQRSENKELTNLNNILAERTYDESGSYKVKGFNIFSEQHPSNRNLLNVVVDSGKAYVQGFMVDKPTPTRTPIPKAQEMKTVLSEAFYYNNSTRRGLLGNSPVSEVNRVTAQVRVTKESVNRGGTSGGTDSLANSSVTSIVAVWVEEDGSTDGTYTQGVDFQIVNGNAISWEPAGTEPPAGGTYFVTYNYNKTMVKDTDYKVVTEGALDSRLTYIDFNGMAGNKPLPDTMVLVDYDYFLAREDLILVDKTGAIFIQEGQPDSMSKAKKPDSNDPYSLVLGSILVYPNSTTTIPRISTLSRLSMLDLQNMKNRIDNLEYNQALNALDQPAMEDINPLVLRGVFSDGFISTEKYDRSHPDANIGFSFEDAEITLPYASADKVTPTFLKAGSNAHVWGRLITAPFTEEKAISQPLATEAMNINPYNIFNNQGILKLTPSEDNWVDEQNVTLYKDQGAEVLGIRQWWRHRSSRWVESEMQKVSNVTLDDGLTWDDIDASGKDLRKGDKFTGQILKAGGEKTKESMIDFMRQIPIQFHATNLTPNANNLTLLFDGKRVNITPASGFNQGSEIGTIMSNSSGEAKGTFEIPVGVRTGVREVSLENTDNTATATFVAEGINKVVENTILRTRVTVNLIDPLAQSFQFRENKVISSFDLFFASKDTSKNVTVQVRGISEGGTPNKTIYAETLLTPSQITTSADGSVPTKVAFDDPLVVDSGKEYALVLLTDTDGYTVWTAKRGQQDLQTGNTVTSNPYITGVLYSSSNASAWTIHQGSDLTFNAYTARFNETAVLEFDSMDNIAADALVLMASYLTPQNTGCVWDVKIIMENEPKSTTIDSKAWTPLANYEEIELNQIAREVKLRATFSTNRNMSPIMSLNDLLLTSFLSALSGSYVSRTIDTTEAPYNTLKISYEAFTPSNTSVTPRFSTDSGDTWREFTTEPVTTQQTDEFTRYEYEEEVTTSPSGLDSLKIRLDMQTQNSFARPRAKRLLSNFRFE